MALSFSLSKVSCYNYGVHVFASLRSPGSGQFTWYTTQARSIGAIIGMLLWIACWAQCVSIRCDREAPVCAPGSLSTASCVVCTYLPTVLWPATMCTGYCTASCVNHVYAGFYVAVYIIIYYVWCGIECVVFFSLVHKTDYGALYAVRQVWY